MIKSYSQYSFKLHIFFAFVIASTTFTKLRGSEEHSLFPFLPQNVGPADILFVLTILALGTLRLNRTFFLYIFCFLLVVSSTIVINLYFNLYMSDKGVLHDIMAMLVNILFLSALINNKKISIPNLLDAFYIILSIYLLLMFISGVLLEQGFFYWEYNIDNQRLSGLSRNPNQIALLVLFHSGLSLFFLDKASTFLKRVLHFSSFLLSITIASFVSSDALSLGLIALLFFAIIFRLPKYLAKLFIIFLIPISLVLTFSNIQPIENYLSTSFQVQERLARWLSFEHLLPQVFFVGFGPGGHGPSFEDSFSYVVGDPLKDTEFHNSFLDFFSQYGILFSMILLSMYLYYLLRINNAKLHLLIALALGTFVISFFHMYTRQPLFWLLVLIPFIYQYKDKLKYKQ
jgi:hypothetical protein